MRQSFLLALCLLLAAFSDAQINNNSFEQWTGYTGTNTLGIPFAGQNPVSWTTSDSLAQNYLGVGLPSVFPGSDPHDGSKSLHLKSTQITVVISGFPLQITVPGIATNGSITGDLTLKVAGGTPDTSRSSKLIGYLKYVPAAAIDKAYLTVLKLKYNPVTGQRDTIAKGEITVDDTVAAYQPFEVVLNYRDFVNQPDTNLIILKSGYLPETVVFSNPDVTVGSELTIDELSFTGFVGVDEVSPVKDFNVFPSPAHDIVNVSADINGRSDWRIQVLDLSGRQMMSGAFGPAGSRIDVASWAAGNYLLQLVDEQGTVAATRRFSVAQ